jgi:hypothetical protein
LAKDPDSWDSQLSTAAKSSALQERNAVNGFLEELMQIKPEPALQRERVSMLGLVNQRVGEASSQRAMPAIQFS